MAFALVPKQFLCRYELKQGANAYGILMIAVFSGVLLCVSIVNIACIIAAIVDMVSFTPCEGSHSVKRSAYAFCIITIIYSIVMVAVNFWFLWAVRKNKASVVLVWVAMSGLWLGQTTVLTIVLLCLYIAAASFLSWIMCLIFGIIAFVICLYGVLIAYGLWVEMKGQNRLPAPTS